MKDTLKNFRYLSLLLLMVAGVSANGQSPPSPPPPGASQSQMAGDPIRQLNLTPEQREQIRLIREQNRDERSSVNQRVRETNRALEEVLNSDSPDESLVEQRLREAEAAQGAAMRMRILTELKIRRVLSSEQRVLLRSLRHGAHERRSERRLEGQEQRLQRRHERTQQMRERRNNPALTRPAAPQQRRPIL
ncbi:MAG TPA: periplasmic heavy metal sensor [Pyrinomonadaceae bacterium]|nr:periplasmic heavy metal sensor [Pyrinomonadaceae bacterium]